MKKLLLAITVLASSAAFGQINFIDSNTSWEQLSAQALKEQKLIFIQLESMDCEQCREVATQGFSSPVIKKKFDAHFVSIRLDVDSENGKTISRKLGVRNNLISIFADPEGNVLHRYAGSTNSTPIYISQADIALSKRGQKSLSAYQKEFNAGERSSTFMRGYIVKVKEAAQPYDLLLDEYVMNLPPDSLKNIGTLKFIYLQGPSIGSDAYRRIIQTVPRETIQQLYQTAAPAEAVAMNRAIIDNSFRNAVQRRDENLAFLSADFLRQSYAPDLQRGQFMYENQMVRFFQATRDTARYVEAVKNFFNTNHLRMPIDSLKKMDDHAMKAMTSKHAGKGENTVTSFGISMPSQFYHIDLNQHAMYFWERINNKKDLETALSWSEYSMKLFDELAMGRRPPGGNPSYQDTYARLLYKLNRRDEAISWQEKAVAGQKAIGLPYGSFQTTLEKMKAGTL